MRKIMVVLALVLVSMGAFAQESVPGIMDVYKGKLCLDGAALSSSQEFDLIGGDIYEETYAGAAKQFKAGKGLTIAGATVTGVGLVGTIAGCATLYQDGSYAMEGFVYFSVGMLVIGDLMLSAGVPLYCIGKSRLSWVADEYNNKYAHRSHVTLAPASQGIGLALKF